MDYAMSVGFHILGLQYSPVKGPEGNIEYLLYIEKKEEKSETVQEEKERIAETVREAHREL